MDVALAIVLSKSPLLENEGQLVKVPLVGCTAKQGSRIESSYSAPGTASYQR